MVQISEEKGSRRAFAMKFFLSEQSFAQERDLYMDRSNPLGQFLPELRMIVDGKSGVYIMDAFNRQLPPCIVMEKGEPLDMWIENTGSLDMVTCLQVCIHYCRKFFLHFRAQPIPKHVVMVLPKSDTLHGRVMRSLVSQIVSALLDTLHALMRAHAGAISCYRALEGPSYSRICASRHQAWKPDVSAP